MGNWRNRPRSYRRRSPQRSWYSGRDFSSDGYGEEDGIPAWEKEFCELIGCVPWQKVVEANYFKSWYQGNVTTWNDAACEEAFQCVKKRFWSEISGLPCDIPLPDPDMFIDEIDWDSVIDPQLITDLELAYFAAPDEGTVDLKTGCRDKNVGNSKMLPEQYNEETDLPKNTWEINGRVDGRNLSESFTDNKFFMDSKNSLNPWEAKTSCRNEAAKDLTWGVCSGKGWGNSQWKTKDRGNDSWEEECWDNDGWNKSGHQNKKTKKFASVFSVECNAEPEMLVNPWEAKSSCGVEARKDATCGACSGKVCRGRGWENNGWGNNRWKNKERGFKSKENKGQGNKYGQNPPGSKGQDSGELHRGCNSWRNVCLPENDDVRDCGANIGGRETNRTSDMKQRKWEDKRSSGEWGDINSYLFRNDEYRSNFRNSRFNRDAKQRNSSDWRNVKVSKNVTFHG
ncbi:PREDICTED: uncharacterized protein LOC104817571 [Tarenaya hassleriana]|uniref:uncharacterized protein LOC104817571 n=1 Tax=Tarenaya hassleriana TaxID=28532 RepID=UPI00053C9C25|nr:PREDICTED: uncharacterized protein LOC104817571 [Tarenaya hassleriana]